jgi:hypothetical protein
MAAVIVPVANTALATDWLTVAEGAEHVLTIIGSGGAELTIEQRVGATADGQPIGRLYVSNSRPEAARTHIPGPFTYRIVRAESADQAGKQRLSRHLIT